MVSSSNNVRKRRKCIWVTSIISGLIAITIIAVTIKTRSVAIFFNKLHSLSPQTPSTECGRGSSEERQCEPAQGCEGPPRENKFPRLSELQVLRASLQWDLDIRHGGHVPEPGQCLHNTCSLIVNISLFSLEALLSTT